MARSETSVFVLHQRLRVVPMVPSCTSITATDSPANTPISIPRPSQSDVRALFFRGGPSAGWEREDPEPYAWTHFELRYKNQEPAQQAVLSQLLIGGRKLSEYRIAP